MKQINIFYNINNEYNDFFMEEELNKNGRYPNLKAFIKCFLDSIGKQYDPDVSLYSMKMYKSKWECLKDGEIQAQGASYKNYKYNKNKYKKQIYLGEKEYLVYGDTLNSMKHIFTHFITEFCKNISNETYKGEMWTNKKYEYILTEFDCIFSDENLNEISWSRLILDQFEIFASLSDTIGNQFPCLPRFNKERANFGKHDFCDLLLEAVYEYLKNPKDTIALTKLFSGIQDEVNEYGSKFTKEQLISNSIERAQYWLEKYFNNSWDLFVQRNCFQYFVKYDVEENKYKEPIKLWDNHSFQNLSYPEISETLYEMLKFINHGIKSRCNLISLKQNL